ncbi:MAG: hypothetical protein CVU69_06165 [Deltaproteobacteria bacterium HGW-Deltaproteobacteria-4]|nr:MAG: hypothetical protein CVU69_06165 [Deltaproteobacteria bacterium HGW-Deltaproteobacteria-4]
MDQPVEAIAGNLRCHRESRSLSLDQLAKMTGVSKSMLRQIEIGKSSPTISTLWKIANGLRISFAALLCNAPVQAEAKSFRAGTPLSAEGERYRLFPMVPFSPQQPFETYYFEIDPGTVFHGEPHNGNVYEYLFLTKGKLRVTVAKKIFEIVEGEFLHFLADSPHQYECMGEEMAAAIIQVSYLP